MARRPSSGGLYRPGVPFRVLAEEAERTILEEAIAQHGGQMAATARALGLERSHLYKKAKVAGTPRQRRPRGVSRERRRLGRRVNFVHASAHRPCFWRGRPRCRVARLGLWHANRSRASRRHRRRHWRYGGSSRRRPSLRRRRVPERRDLHQLPARLWALREPAATAPATPTETLQLVPGRLRPLLDLRRRHLPADRDLPLVPGGLRRLRRPAATASARAPRPVSRARRTAASARRCGNGKCNAADGESCFTCPDDCGKCKGCGDGMCNGTETCASCQQDCGVCSVCGNGKCESGQFETCTNCPADCGECELLTCFQIVTCALGCIKLQPEPTRVQRDLRGQLRVAGLRRRAVLRRSGAELRAT